MIIGRRKLLFEADEENSGFSASSEPEDGADNAAENDNTETQSDSGEDQNDAEDNQEESGDNDEGTEDDGESNEDNEDFNIDAEADDDGGGEEGDTEDSSSDNDSSSDSSSDEDVDNEDTRRDKEMFDSLSPQEQKLKTAKLNELYLELYSNCNYVIDKINSISTPYEELNIQIKKTLSILFNLKQMISDYTTNLFGSKSYIENDINFNRYLAILDSVKAIIKDINKSIGEDETENK